MWRVLKNTVRLIRRIQALALYVRRSGRQWIAKYGCQQVPTESSTRLNQLPKDGVRVSDKLTPVDQDFIRSVEVMVGFVRPSALQQAINWHNAILNEYQLAASRVSPAEVDTRHWFSGTPSDRLHLFRNVADCENWALALIQRMSDSADQQGLVLLAAKLGVEPMPEKVINGSVLLWLQGLMYYGELDLQGSRGNGLQLLLTLQCQDLPGEHALTVRLFPEHFRFIKRLRGAAVASEAAQYLWLHMVGHLLPAIEYFDGPQGLARIVDDRDQLKRRLIKYVTETRGGAGALCDLVEWSQVPMTVDDLCNAVMVWCYWRAFEKPKRATSHIYRDHSFDRDFSLPEGCSENYYDSFVPLSEKQPDKRSPSGRGTRLSAKRFSKLDGLSDRNRQQISDGCWSAWDEAFTPQSDYESQVLSLDSSPSPTLSTPGVWENIVRAQEDG